MPQTRIDADAACNALRKGRRVAHPILTAVGHFMEALDAGLSATREASHAMATEAHS